MDDIIVIVIMVALTIVGAVSRSKKKKTVIANSPTVKPKVSDFWETLFEDNQTEAEELVVQENRIHAQEPVVAAKPKRNTTSKLVEEGSPMTKDKTLHDEIKKSEIGNSGKQKEILEGFSLKKAIIFSEIINQKYF